MLCVEGSLGEEQTDGGRKIDTEKSSVKFV